MGWLLHNGYLDAVPIPPDLPDAVFNPNACEDGQDALPAPQSTPRKEDAISYCSPDFPPRPSFQDPEAGSSAGLPRPGKEVFMVHESLTPGRSSGYNGTQEDVL